MLRIPRWVRVFVATSSINLSTDIDGLLRIVRDCFREDAFTGNIFCFFNHRRDRVKLLVWDRNGFWVFCKRLERGRFELLAGCPPRIEIDRERLVMLLEGIDTRTSRFRSHFAREVRISPRDDDHRSAHVAR